MINEVRCVEWQDLHGQRDGGLIKQYFRDEKESYTGVVVSYHEGTKDVIRCRWGFVNGLEHGLFIRFDISGREIRTQWFKRGQPVISMVEVNEKDIRYEKNLPYTFIVTKSGIPYTGQVINKRPNGSVYEIFYVDQGRLDGENIIYYADGSVKKIRHFTCGVKNGWQKTYLGKKIKIEEWYKNGLKHGFQTIFTNGERVGLEKWKDGELISTTKYI